MVERKPEKIPPRTKRYAAVIEEAERRARMREELEDGSVLVTISDVFEVLCVVHPDSFSQLLNCSISIPVPGPVTNDERPAMLFHSSEVDRYLSPFEKKPN